MFTQTKLKNLGMDDTLWILHPKRNAMSYNAGYAQGFLPGETLVWVEDETARLRDADYGLPRCRECGQASVPDVHQVETGSVTFFEGGVSDTTRTATIHVCPFCWSEFPEDQLLGC